MTHWQCINIGSGNNQAGAKPFSEPVMTQVTAVYVCMPLINSPHPPDKMVAIVADDNFKYIFLNENNKFWTLKFVPRSPLENKSALVQVMTWRRKGDKSLSEPMLAHFTSLTHICGTRVRWVNTFIWFWNADLFSYFLEYSNVKRAPTYT